MNASWQKFLATQPGSDRSLPPEQPLICDLRHYAMIRVQGQDAADFLQSQLSCDMRTLNPRHSQLGTLNTPKGRVLAIMRLLQDGEKIFLLLPASLVESLITHLETFILRSQVSLENSGHDMIALGLAGPGSDDILDLAGLPHPPDVNQVAIDKNLSITRLHGETPRFICTGAVEAVQDAWLRLVEHVSRGRETDWNLRRMLAGVAEIYPETADKFIPQMLNLDALGAVSFSKGCYPGQEIIARARYLGQVKRSLVLGLANVHIDRGESLYTDAEDAPAGNVVESCERPQGDWLVQAVIQTSVVQNHMICKLASGETVKLCGTTDN